MRSGLSLVAGVAILVALGQAPFHHVHEHAHDDHVHQGISAHLHQTRTTGDEVAFRALDPNSDARLINWFQAVERPSIAIDVPEPIALTTAPESVPEQTVRPLMPRGHDPPNLASRSSRAPPSPSPAFAA